MNRLFSAEEIAEIKAIKIADVIAKGLGEAVNVRNAFSIQDGEWLVIALWLITANLIYILYILAHTYLTAIIPNNVLVS